MADLQAEHGLSLYVEANGQRILFDMGQSAGFLDNAKALGVDLSAVDMAVLSHGHYDHGGGLEAFLAVNDHAPVYINPHAFEGHYHGVDRDIGLDGALAGHPRLRTMAGDIGHSMTLYHGLETLVCPIDDAGLHVLEHGVLEPEDYRHEQYLLVEEQGKRILFSGCSHRGILNIVHQFAPDVLIGGFHCSAWEAPRLNQLATDLMSFTTQYYTCHCTGTGAYQVLKSAMGVQLDYLSGGRSLEV